MSTREASRSREPIAGTANDRIEGKSGITHQLTSVDDSSKVLLLRWSGTIGEIEVIRAYSIKADMKENYMNYEFRIDYTFTPSDNSLALAHQYGMTTVKRTGDIAVYEYPATMVGSGAHMRAEHPDTLA